MKQFFMLFGLTAAFLFLQGNLQAQDTRFDHPVIQLDGSENSFSEIAANGNSKLVVFWASWCGACKGEMQQVEENIEKWQDEYNTELVLISVDRPNARERAKSMVEAKGWSEYTNVFDKTNFLFSGFKAYGLPLTLTVNGQGEVTGYWKGNTPRLMSELDFQLKKMYKKSCKKKKKS